MEEKYKSAVILVDCLNANIEQASLKFLEFDKDNSWKFVYLTKNKSKSTSIKWLSIIQWIIGICRSHKLLPTQRCLILPTSLQQQVIQLCLAKQSKENCGEFSASASDVLDVWKLLKSCDKLCGSQCLDQNYLMEAVKSYQDFLTRCSSLDHFGLKKIVQEQLKQNTIFSEVFKNKIFVVNDLSSFSEIERDLLSLIVDNCRIVKATSSASSKDDFDISGIGLNESLVDETDASIGNSKVECTDQSNHEIGFTAVDESFQELLLKDSISYDSCNSPARMKGSTMYVEQLFLAHMRLLVNTRDELALATTLGMPGREISEKEFNKIKSVAQSKNMPIYQAIMSTVLRLELGGQGYKPDPSCPIVKNAKALSELVTLINLLQEIIEEEKNGRKGFEVIINRLKTNLLRTKGCSLPRKSINQVHSKILSEIDVYDDYFVEQIDNNSNGEKQVASQTFTIDMSLQPTLKLIVGACDVDAGRSMTFSVSDLVGDHLLTQKTPGSQGKKSTPLKVPSILSMFRSPSSPTSPKVGKMNSPKEDSLRVRAMKQRGLEQKVTSQNPTRYKSSYSWLPEDLSPIYKGSPVSPSETSPVIGPTLNVLAPKNESRIDWNKVLPKPAALPQIRPGTTQKPKNRSKRSLLTDIANLPAEEPKQKKIKENDPLPSKKVPSKPKTKKAAKPVLLKGQRSITSFFSK